MKHQEKDTIIEVVAKEWNNSYEILEFYTTDGDYRYPLGCIMNYEGENDDFGWLFNYLPNLHWKLEKFGNCRVNEADESWEDEWDRYNEKTIYHNFCGVENTFEIFVGDLNDSKNNTLEDVFKFVEENTKGIKFKIDNLEDDNE